MVKRADSPKRIGLGHSSANANTSMVIYRIVNDSGIPVLRGMNSNAEIDKSAIKNNNKQPMSVQRPLLMGPSQSGGARNLLCWKSVAIVIIVVVLVMVVDM